MLGAVNWGHDRGCIYVPRGRAVESGPFLILLLSTLSFSPSTPPFVCEISSLFYFLNAPAPTATVASTPRPGAWTKGAG